MTSASSLNDVVSQLQRTFSGQLLLPSDPGYDDARSIHNGLIDKRPSLIARCRGVADIADAIKVARDRTLEIAVRGGGHNVAGRATTDGGIMIDLSAMTGMHVDAKARTIRAQGGVTWGGFNRETQLFGLAATGGVVSTTGVGGLTLGGGIGWLTSKHGLALDNLISAEIVLADGRVVTASMADNPDLFWGLRGGGGNFGVAASLEFRLYPVGPLVTAGVIAWPLSAARDVMRFYREITASLPDEFMIYAAFLHAEDAPATKLIAIVLCHCGSLEAGERAVQPIKQFGTPVMDAIGAMPYTDLNMMLDASYPRGALNYWKSSFLSGLSDAAIDTMIDCFAECQTPESHFVLEHFHGAVTRIGVADTAFPFRSEGYNFLILGQWTHRKDSDAAITWARKAYSAMQPFVGTSRYVNYLGDDETTDSVASAYGTNYRRLQKVKATYDPENVFRMNQNIRPLA